METVGKEHSRVLSKFLSDTQVLSETDVANLSSSALILESSPALGRLLAKGLSTESIEVYAGHDVSIVAKLLEEGTYHLLILDLDHPSLDYRTFLRELRSKQPRIAILVLSRDLRMESLVAALDHGADCYLQKPFSLLEFLAQIRALRRRLTLASKELAPKCGTVVLHRDQCRVERDGKFIDLSPREFSLLEYMVQNPGRTLSRASLSQEVWNSPAEANSNIVNVYVKYLRDKLDGDYETKLIRTVRGAGYVFQTP